ncbi:MAG: sigma-70 family RNA polymerase sigma factor [Elusimicrobia bacterium]|nr:sigma-70 family RNA polymerase sigma factor [Elusimicrobiota bacterium]
MTALSDFETFVRAYQDMVYTTAIRLLKDPGLSEDVAQETFLKAWERFEDVRGYEAPGGWLKTVATHLALNRLTRDRNRWEPVDAAADAVDPGGSPAAQVEDAHGRAELEDAVAALPDHQRVPLVLFHFHDASYEDIAASLGVSLSKIKTDIFRAREALRKRLEATPR